ncbi:MAG: J domain-containing protein [Dyella sp.]|uniref:J domain-containing protein n=1 Tax=Dyella sp. TaxID=1869338 RepID=UPI003F7E1C1F
MNWAFELLGLRPDAEAADVKRAYARLLRTTRPDEDAEAFQRLHAAYKTALAHANRKAAASPAASISAPHTEAARPSPALTAAPATPPSTPAHAPNVSVPVVAMGPLTGAVIQAAVDAQNGNALLRWLQSRAEFWSIQVKSQAAQVVLQRLFQQPQAISAECMDTLLQFFDLNHVLSGVNPVALQNLRMRQRTLWELVPQNHHELARRAGLMRNGRPDVLLLRKNLALLERTLHWIGATRAAMQSDRARSLANLVRVLSNNGRIDDLPPSIDRPHATFWLRAATAGAQLTRERFILNSLRASVFALITVLVVVGVGVLSAGSDGVNWREMARVSGVLGGSVLGLWLLLAGCWWFDQWQGMPESAPTRWPWLRRLAIPAVCASSLAVYSINQATLTQLLISLCFIFSIRKLRRRLIDAGGIGKRFDIPLTPIIWVGIMTISVLSRMHSISDISLMPVLALLTLAISIADLWRHRAYLHPKLARN